MFIPVTKGVGSGRTILSAFDNALYNAGIANYNLIPLSSVLPPGSTVKIVKPNQNDIEFGHRLFVVISRKDQEIIGQTACAGLGWIQKSDNSGLFVEHVGESEEGVRRLIQLSLEDMTKYRDDHFGPIQMEIAKIECVDRPVCAIVAAVYQSERW